MKKYIKSNFCNIIMILKTILYMIYLTNSESVSTYPTRNWLKICNSSTVSNKTTTLRNNWRDYWRENLDTLYL
jgi:hypothetical protein